MLTPVGISANKTFLDILPLKTKIAYIITGGIKRILHGAFCLETQTEPNAVNHGIGIYDKGDVYTHTTAFKIEKTKE